MMCGVPLVEYFCHVAMSGHTDGSIVDFGSELLNKGIDLVVRAQDTFLAQQVSDAGTYILSLFRSEEYGGSGTHNGTTDESVKHG